MHMLNAQNNTCEGASWSWSALAYTEKKTHIRKVPIYMANYIVEFLKKTILEVDVQVPPDATHKSWGCTSQLRSNRVALTRTGQQLNGEEFSIAELVNINLAVTSNVPEDAQKLWRGMQQKHAGIIRLQTVKPGTKITDLVSDVPFSVDPSSTSSRATSTTKAKAKDKKKATVKPKSSQRRTSSTAVRTRATKKHIVKRPSKRQ